MNTLIAKKIIFYKDQIIIISILTLHGLWIGKLIAQILIY